MLVKEYRKGLFHNYIQSLKLRYTKNIYWYQSALCHTYNACTYQTACVETEVKQQIFWCTALYHIYETRVKKIPDKMEYMGSSLVPSGLRFYSTLKLTRLGYVQVSTKILSLISCHEICPQTKFIDTLSWISTSTDWGPRSPSAHAWRVCSSPHQH